MRLQKPEVGRRGTSCEEVGLIIASALFRDKVTAEELEEAFAAETVEGKLLKVTSLCFRRRVVGKSRESLPTTMRHMHVEARGGDLKLTYDGL